MHETDLAVLNDILAEVQKSLDPTMPQDEFWEFFAAKEILRDRQLSPDDIQSGIVGQKQTVKESDGGIDGFYIFVNGTLIRDQYEAENIGHKTGIDLDVMIIQSKISPSFSLQAINRLSNTCESIFKFNIQPAEFAEKYNARLMDAIVRFRTVHKTVLTRQPTINVYFFYATKGDAGTTEGLLRKKADELQNNVKSNLATVRTCEFAFIGARDFIDLWNAPRKCQFSLRVLQSFPDGKGGYVALVELGEYYKFITENDQLRDFLFESNVRSYEGNGQVNKQIKETLENKSLGIPFWWLNNGITIVTTHITPGSPDFVIHDPQVVNGLQTSEVLFRYFKESQCNPIEETRQTLVKIIKPPSDEVQDRIIRATNSQTKIPLQFLRASDDFQRDIEIRFKAAGLYYDRRKNTWRNLGVKLPFIVGVSELAQCVASIILLEPDHARARPSRYFKEEALYKKAFNPKRPIEEYITCARIKKHADRLLKTFADDDDVIADLKFYVMTVVGNSMFKKDKKAFRALDVSKIADTVWMEAWAKVLRIYQKYGANDSASKGTGMIHELLAELGLPPRRDVAPRRMSKRQRLAEQD